MKLLYQNVETSNYYILREEIHLYETKEERETYTDLYTKAGFLMQECADPLKLQWVRGTLRTKDKALRMLTEYYLDITINDIQYKFLKNELTYVQDELNKAYIELNEQIKGKGRDRKRAEIRKYLRSK